jgi:hypothetical protein
MKKTSLPLIALLLLAGVIYISCQKSDTPDIDNYNTYKTELVTADISGRIVDENQLPVSDATVKSGTASVTTDASGTFRLANLSVDKHAGSITVEKAGYFKAVKTIVVTPNKDNTVSLQLIKKTITGSFSGTSGGNITLPTGGRVVFSSNAIVTDGTTTAYTGTVAVSAFFINPEANNFQEIMPGTLRGITTNNEETGLQSFGMMAVELNGTGGEKLQLAKGKTAGITFPIPASLRASAPATIPLWSLDEKTGLWKEEGFATRQGNDYIGEVGHFSYWNCDAPFKVIDFTATIKTQDNNGLASAKVVISATGADTALSGFGHTNTDGIVSGKIPANRNLTMKVYDKCGTLLHTKNVGPFTDNTDLRVTTISSTATTVSFTGTVVNCSAAAVTSGYVTINVEGIYYQANLVNGVFSLTVARCSNTATSASITPYDLGGTQSGQPTTIDVSGTTVNAGQLVACGNNISQFINYNINGTSYSYTAVDSLLGYRSLQSEQTIISGFEGNREVTFAFRGEASPGISPIYVIYIKEGNNIYRKNGDITVNVTEYTNTTGGFIAGNFTGSVKDTLTSNILPISCTFRVMKSN